MHNNPTTPLRRLGQRLFSYALACLTVSLLSALAVPKSANAQVQTQTLTIAGGKGNVGAIAQNIEYYNPTTGLWQPAYLADKRPSQPGVEHDWGVLAGTDHWINYKSNGSLTSDAGASGTNTLWYLYRVRFTVPADAQSATMSFSLKADNRARVAINGVSTGAEIVGQATGVNADAVFAANVHPGENTITINVGDEGGLNGLNFLITLSVQSAQPLAIVTPPAATNWVNWTGSVVEGGLTKYVGQIVVPRTSGGTSTIIAKYTPPNQTVTTDTVYRSPGIAFIQTAGGTDFWKQGSSGTLGRNPARSPYTSAKVTTIPDGGGSVNDLSDIIALRFAGTNTLEFRDASTGQPISIASPVFAYVSLNGNGYGFNQDFDILSFGDGSSRDQGYFGSGTSSKTIATVNGATQYQLLGTGEPHGTLQFRGSFSTVTWQSLSNEYWNGFTIGVAQVADDIPIANAGPDQTVNATSANGAAVQLAGSGSGSTKTPYTFSWTGPFGSANGAAPTVSLPIGTHTITLTVTDTAGVADTDTVVITVLANPAPVITSSATASGVYGSPFSYTITATNSPTSFGAIYLPPGLTLNGAVISGTPTATGSFGVNLSAQNSGGTGTRTLLLTINNANATVVATPYSVTYDGNPHTASFTITGVNGESGAVVGTVVHNTTHTNAGTYADTWSFTGGANYNSIPATAITNAIAKANATVAVSGYTGTYDGAAHGATGVATGVGGANLNSSLNLGATFTNAPGGTASWTFNGGTNYNDQSGTAVIAIAKADAIIAVNGYTGTYDAAAHGASGTATGVGGVDLSAGLTLGASFTDAPGGTASWTFAGGTNYNDASGTAPIVIAKADATVTINGYTGIYDGAAHGASGSAAGVGGVNLSSGLTLGASFTNVPGGSASWTFAGGTNYNDQSGAVAITINKATPTVVVAPYSVTYNGAAHSSTVTSITGVNGETGATVGTVTLNTTHTNAGTYTDSWSLTGAANYRDIASTPITNVIAKASATVVVAPYSVTYTGNPHSATVTSITGVNGETGATVGSVTLNTTHTNAGTYADTWSFTGAANYLDIAATSITNTIAKANPVITVTGYNLIYDGLPHTAIGSATGVKGEALSGLNLAATTRTNVGTTTDGWSFTDTTGNYNNANGSVTDVITKAATKVVLGAVPSVQAVNQPITLTATVTALTTVSGSPDGTVTFNLGATVLGTATVNASGVAVLTTTAIPVGPQAITAVYSGSANFVGSSSNSVAVLVYGYPAGGGTFVIGDGNAAVGAAVTFWGAQWEKNNDLSGGASNASFKGFASSLTAVGGTFTAAPGNSGPSPASVPAYLGVLVTSKVTKSGANITGTVVRLVVVKTNPGYAGNPGSAGTGTVVAVIP